MYYTARSLIPELYDDSNPKLARMKNLMGKAYGTGHLHSELLVDLLQVLLHSPCTCGKDVQGHFYQNKRTKHLHTKRNDNAMR
jgi:hypothetical protein